jgi:hypothetical protein
MWWFRKPGSDVRKRLKEETARREAGYRERKRLRIAELQRDPAKHKYIPLVEQGQQWSDEQIAYREDATITATCPHLQQIERGMREAGIVPMLQTQWDPNGGPILEIDADCCVNEPELRAGTR